MKNDKWYLIIILLFSLLFFIWIPRLHIGDDTIFHTSNIIANAKTETILPHKILPLIENNLGYGTNIFYPPLPHLVGSYIYRIINNIEVTMIILQFLSIFLAGITMYYYIKITSNNKNQAFIAALIYLSSPYLFTDVFPRGALNESFLFFILPIIFLSYHYLINNNNKNFYLFFILGFSLSIYTHLVLTIYITLISLIYLIFKYKKVFTKKNIINLIIGTIIVLGITSPFTILLIEHYILNDYNIFTIKYITGLNFHFYPISLYIFPKTIYSEARDLLRFHYHWIFYIYLIFLGLIPMNKKTKKTNISNIIPYLIILIICLILETNNHIWKIIPNVFKNIQFTWRLSLVLSFVTAIIASYGINLFNKKNTKYITIITIILLLITNYSYCKLPPNKENNQTYLNQNSNEKKYSWQQEYLPTNTINNRTNLSIIENNFKSNNNTTIIKNKVPYLKFKINKTVQNLELPRIYYLGYELTKNNKKIPLTKSSNGLLQAESLNKGIYTLNYKGTILSRIFTLIAPICILLYLKIVIKK